jgi:hypothetical protein
MAQGSEFHIKDYKEVQGLNNYHPFNG